MFQQKALSLWTKKFRSGENKRGVHPLLTAALIALITPSLALAAPGVDFECLGKIKGKPLRWDPTWQTDGSDENILYIVSGVQDNRSKTNRNITIELGALTPAKRSVRYLTITSTELAETICRRTLVATSKNGELANTSARDRDGTQLGSGKMFEEAELRFIHYLNNKGWVFGDPPPYEALTTCEILGKKFRCLLAERQAHGEELGTIEEELRINP